MNIFFYQLNIFFYHFRDSKNVSNLFVDYELVESDNEYITRIQDKVKLCIYIYIYIYIYICKPWYIYTYIYI